MLRKIAWLALALMVFSVAGVATAQEKDLNLVDTRVGPENFRMQGGAAATCFAIPTSIPDNDPAGVTTSLSVSDGCGPIEDLDFFVQISHTWVGDLSMTLSKSGGASAIPIDQPGVDGPGGGGFGCSGDDYDCSINDEAATAVEAECGAGVPAIQGDFIGGDPTGPVMAAFDGEELCGDWDLNVVDNAGGDLGTIFEWCVIPGTDGGGDDGGDDVVPASNTIGIFLMLVLLVGSSVYFMRRRVMN